MMTWLTVKVTGSIDSIDSIVLDDDNNGGYEFFCLWCAFWITDGFVMLNIRLEGSQNHKETFSALQRPDPSSSQPDVYHVILED